MMDFAAQDSFWVVAYRLLQVLIAIPGYVIVLFCCYSLINIGYKLAVFPECPCAAESLMEDIDRARNALNARGFRFVD